MDERIDKKTRDLLLDSLERIRMDAEAMKEKRQQKLWKETDLPCPLSTVLNRLTKEMMDDIRKKYDIRNVSSLKKNELAAELTRILPDRFKSMVQVIDQEVYGLLHKAADNSGFIATENIPFHKVETFMQYGLLFPGHYKGQNILFMPAELQTAFSEIDDHELQQVVQRNSEWISLTRGLLYYFGVMDSIEMVKELNTHADEKIEGRKVMDYFDVMSFSMDYDEQLERSVYGMKDERVFDANEILDEHNKRRSLNYYRFAKSDLLKAGVPDYIDKPPAAHSFIRFLSKYYDLAAGQSDDILFQLIKMINMDKNSEMMIQYLQSQLGEFPSVQFAEELMEQLMDLHNNTRMWVLKGYTPNELFEGETKQLKPLPSAPFKTSATKPNVVDLKNYKKTGRNDPCPCGSGKKYKKCCLN